MSGYLEHQIYRAPDRLGSPPRPDPPLKEQPTALATASSDHDLATIRQLILDNGARLGKHPQIVLQRFSKDVDASKIISNRTDASSTAKTKIGERYSAALVVQVPNNDKTKLINGLYVGLIGRDILEALMHLLNKTSEAMKEIVDRDVEAAKKDGGRFECRLYA